MNLNFTEPGRSVEKFSGFFLRGPSIVFAMRVSVFYVAFLACSMQMLLASSGNGQTIAEIEVTLGMRRGENLESLFKNIEKQSGLLFAYDYGKVNQYNNIRLGKAKRTIKETLDIVLKETPFVYSQIKNSVIIFPEGEEKYGGDELIPMIEAQATVNPLPLPVTGKVTDAEGTPMAGVNIVVKGTTRGTSTDADGKFTIDAEDNETLVFSFIGYLTKEVTVSGRTIIDVALEEDITGLEAVVINAGYWNVKQREKTGNISRVASKEIEDQPVSNVLQALQGRMAGVVITQTSGVPGNVQQIQVRGRNSLRDDGNYPLYIIDGVPIVSSPLTSYGTLTPAIDPLNTINPANVESIEVLKDADATAIYGSRGANGVVLITTKKGKSGTTDVDIQFYKGVGEVTNKMDLLNTKQYLEMRKEAFANDEMVPSTTVFPPDHDLISWDSTRYTDWQEEFFGGTGNITDAQVSISGGTASTSFRFGGSFHEETNVFPKNFGYQKASGHLNLSHSTLDDKFKVILSINYGIDKNDLFNSSIVYQALILAPNAPALYDEDGNLNWENSTWTNPLRDLAKSHKITTNNFISNAVLTYEIFPGVNVKANLGYTNLQSHEAIVQPISSFNPASLSIPANQRFFTGTSNNGNYDRKSWIIEPQIVYAKDFADHRLDIVLGTTFQENVSTSQAILGLGYNSDALLGNISAAPSLNILKYDNTLYRYAAFFGRVGYNWKEKYLVNLTARRDGSSRFGPNKQFANFGAVGVAWIFSNEKFIIDKFRFLTFGKIRSSFGTSGSDQIGDYGYLDTYRPTRFSFQGNSSLYPTALSNPDYAWELNRKLEAAVELGFLNDRIFFTASWYRNRSSNQLVGYPLPAVTGFSSVQFNLPASVQNSGLELELSTNVGSRNLKLRSSINFTIPKNKLLEYENLQGSSYADRYVVGEPLTIQKLYQAKGIDSSTGIYQFLDVDNDGSFSGKDKQVIRDVGRKYYGGFHNTIAYKSFELDFLIEVVSQNGRNHLYMFNVPPGFQSNQPRIVMDRWKETGDISSNQKFTKSFDNYNAYSMAAYSNLSISNASYIRLKTLSLSYKLPTTFLRKINVEHGRLYVQSQNLFTITDYIGLDPSNPGSIDLPPLTVLTFGIQLNL